MELPKMPSFCTSSAPQAEPGVGQTPEEQALPDLLLTGGPRSLLTCFGTES